MVLYFSTSVVTLHIYVHPNIQYLNALLKEDMSLVINQPSTLETVGNVPKNYWLIQLPDNANESTIISMFQETYLRYDTMAFVFAVHEGTVYGRKHFPLIILGTISGSFSRSNGSTMRHFGCQMDHT